MIEAMIWLQGNMMDVEVAAHESHVNPFKTERKVAPELLTVKRQCGAAITVMKMSSGLLDY